MARSFPSFHMPSGRTVKERCTSLSAWELPRETSSIAPDYVWTNKDMDPVPPKNQTWSVWTWMAYWATDMINLGTWETASSIIAVGLNWRDCIPILAVGTFCIAVPMVLNGAIGAHLHLPFSVVVRSGFGYYFAYFCIVSRAVLAMFWLGVQSVNGAQAMTVMIGSIWPSYWQYAYGGPHNSLPASAGISTQGMISYFLFWIIQLPLLLIPPTHLRYLFATKLVAAPIAALAIMGWCVHQAGGGGSLFDQPTTVHGSERAWLWLSCMTAVTGTWATLACNIMDFSRYARPNAAKAQYVQLPFLTIAYTLCGVLGIVTTSASHVIWGQYYWNPLDILSHWAQDYSHGGRAAAFFAALAWYIAQVGTNITANSISAANDLTVLCPRYINIRRGSIIAAVVGGWVIVPWKILASAQTFLDFMGGYSVFLAPIAGIIAADYWLVKRRKLDVPALYDPHGRYRYWAGINIHGMIAFAVSVAPNLPGLAQSITPKKVSVSIGAQHLYAFGWLYGFVTSVVLYTLLNLAMPWKAALVEETIYGVEVGAEGSDGESSGPTGEKQGHVGRRLSKSITGLHGQ
ncbi:uridine permease-like protein Fui1 [Myriangium duriaei CBS 260.36]|uniref:Uridine permease-like protein Fui1 n=1 Tax=Myriangium duriaei CBS 260.36 TaxID=1168546 RepID=A0A9P4J9M8_9PEZI|nr:uridine permease-like protein Fui1 [Myriangium duriaei CBS 260.36]